MKRSLLKIRTCLVCAGLAIWTVGSWSCQKDDLLQNDKQKTENTIAQARAYYERTAVPLTKTVGEREVPIKPLPGEMTPQWDRATAAVQEGANYVDVPISAAIAYTAIRGGHHHQAGDACGHDHSAVQAVQKLTVQTSADGSQRSLVATIVPEPGCTVELNGFCSATGLAGFSGFVSWHDLTGQLIRVAAYENGIQTRSAVPDGTNEAEIAALVDRAILYPTVAEGVQTKGYDDDPCPICEKTDCRYKNNKSWHCDDCKQNRTNCHCLRCNVCGNKGSFCTCKEPSGPSGDICRICGRVNCPDHVLVPEPWPREIVQEDLLRAALGSLATSAQLERILDASYGMDQEYQNQGDEYRHGLYIPGYADEQQTAFQNMKTHFVQKVQGYLFLTAEHEMAGNESFYYLGMALHPIADHYVLLRQRVEMLKFYSYSSPRNILSGTFIVPHSSQSEPSVKALRFLFNAVQTLNRTASDSQIETIFDQWLQMAGAQRP
jgi:hypothetical protein